MDDRIEKIKKIANNTLLFNDSSDYENALWEILQVVNPDMEAEDCDDLVYID